MVKVFCDRCGADCGLNAYAIRIENIHNRYPSFPLDIGPPYLGVSHERCQFTLCQDCYLEIGLPNLYEVQNTKEIRFRGVSESDNG